MGLSPGGLILANTFTYLLEDGTPVEAGVISYRIDRCKFKYEVPFSQAARVNDDAERTQSDGRGKAAGRK